MRKDTAYVSLFVLPIAAAVCAGTIIYCALNYRNRSSFDSVIYATIAMLAIYSLLVLTASAARRTPLIVWISILAAFVGLAGSLAVIVLDFQREIRVDHTVYWRRDRLMWTIMGYGWLIGSAACFIALVKSAHLSAPYNFIRWLTIAALVALAFVIGLCLPDPSPILLNEYSASRAIGVFAAASGLGLFTTLVLARVTQLENRRRLLLDLPEIKIECPRCQTSQNVGLGESSCVQCKLRFEFALRENVCEKCGYAHYRLESPTCPECGTSISKSPVEP